MKIGTPVEAELKALVRLLDDETPAVRERIAARLLETTGDLSEALAEIGWGGSAYEQDLLSGILHPARRETLRREWCVPSGGLGDDWETLEHLLRLLSDFLHDGVNLRQSLPDALDLLAEEAEEQGGARKMIFAGIYSKAGVSEAIARLTTIRAIRTSLM